MFRPARAREARASFGVFAPDSEPGPLPGLPAPGPEAFEVLRRAVREHALRRVGQKAPMLDGLTRQVVARNLTPGLPPEELHAALDQFARDAVAAFGCDGHVVVTGGTRRGCGPSEKKGLSSRLPPGADSRPGRAHLASSRASRLRASAIEGGGRSPSPRCSSWIPTPSHTMSACSPAPSMRSQ